MPIGITSPYFNLYEQKDEQRLLEDLICESISIYGVPCYYISRTFNAFDPIYGTDESSSYNNAWLINIFLQNVLGFTGDREFMSKFAGLEIRDQVIFSIPRRIFQSLIADDPAFPPLPPPMTGEAARPREGDLIWFPFNKKCFKIMYVNLTDHFFQLGKLYTWSTTCELFEYSGEVFNTGIKDIDRIQVEGSLNVLDYLVYDVDGVTPLLTDPDGSWWVTDRLQTIYPLQDNINVDVEANNYIEWDNTNVDPFSSGNTSPGV